MDRVRSLLCRGRVDNSKPVKRVLVIKLLGLGTILLTPGLIKSLRKLIPGVQVDFLTFEQFRPAVELIGGIDKLQPLSARSPWAFAVSTVRALKKLRANHYDAVIDLDYFSRFTMMLSYLIGARRRAGFYSPRMYRGRLLTDPLEYTHDKHRSQSFCDVAALLAGAGLPQ